MLIGSVDAVELSRARAYRRPFIVHSYDYLRDGNGIWQSDGGLWLLVVAYEYFSEEKFGGIREGENNGERLTGTCLPNFNPTSP